jgi:WD40 repeat protein
VKFFAVTTQSGCGTWAASGRCLASDSDDKTIRLWNLAKGAEIERMEGHFAGITALCMMPDGRLSLHHER